MGAELKVGAWALDVRPIDSIPLPKEVWNRSAVMAGKTCLGPLC